jgi:uncharacterized protein
LANREHLSPEDKALVDTATHFHDLGFVRQHTEHEAASAEMAADVLPHFGYTPRQIQRVVGMILATRLPQSPRTLAEQVVADADLDVLGRDDFMSRNLALRSEQNVLGNGHSDEDWYRAQLLFLRQHHYFTMTARELRGDGKQRNLVALQRLLEGYRPQPLGPLMTNPSPSLILR